MPPPHTEIATLVLLGVALSGERPHWPQNLLLQCLTWNFPGPVPKVLPAMALVRAQNQTCAAHTQRKYDF